MWRKTSFRWLFSALMLLKFGRWIWFQMLGYSALQESAVFIRRNRMEFFLTALMLLFFGLLPYISFCILSVFKARSSKIGMATLLAVAIADISTDIIFGNYSDARNGADVLIWYGFSLILIYVLFKFTNYMSDKSLSS